VYYISNNAIRSRESLQTMLRSLSLPADYDKIICAGYSCATYLLSKYSQHSKVFVIGSQGLEEEILLAGFEVVSCRSMESIKLTTSELGSIVIENDIKVVIVGFTPKLNFYMLSYAVNCLENGAELVTGNYDCSDKFGKYNVPGSACTVEFLRFANKHGFVNVGKPESFMIERIIQRDGLDKHECIMFGDKMDTDIKLAKNTGIMSALVLTGVEKIGTFENKDFQPDFVIENLNFSFYHNFSLFIKNII
jgi:Predicted sugar phosphatases of the HAD superfamily